MATADERLDAYIAKAAPFAQPLLTQLRAWVHAACPEAEETIKWGMPFFLYRGAILGHMAAFKAHCAFGVWRGGPGSDAAKSGQAMGQLGRIEGRAAMLSDELRGVAPLAALQLVRRPLEQHLSAATEAVGELLAVIRQHPPAPQSAAALR